MIIGVLDTGKTRIMLHLVAMKCRLRLLSGKGRVSSMRLSCNNKLIGVRSFNIGAMVSNVNTKVNSPLDDSGHGKHTTSTAAGVFVKNAQAFGGATASTAVGMVHMLI